MLDIDTSEGERKIIEERHRLRGVTKQTVMDNVASSIGNLRISRPDLLSDVIIGSSPDAEEEFMAQVIHNYRGAYSESR